jgi:hypothetical protein
MHDGGFGMIVGNPPWVRTHSIPPSERAQLKRGFKTLRDCAWTAGGRLARIKGFASQPDLSVCFVEQGVRWLRKGGVLGLLLPSKLARALYAGGVRRLLADEAPPNTVFELEGGHFDGATTYPMALVATKGGQEGAVRVGIGLYGTCHDVPTDQFRLISDDAGSPWILSPTAERPQRQADSVLGDFVDVRRGFMTGCNEAFVLKDEESFPGSEVLAVRGADLRAFSFRPGDRMLWTHDTHGGAVRDELPPAVAAHLHPYRARLDNRNGLRPSDHYWRILRTGPHLFQHKVAWRDMGPRLEAVALPRALNGVPVVPLNTVYFVPVATHDQALLLAAWFNATANRDWADAVAERASGGYRRYFAWILSLLPIPAALGLAVASDAGAFVAALQANSSLGHLIEASRAAHAGEERAEEIDLIVHAIQRGILTRVVAAAQPLLPGAVR